jgi:release factor glutamine methyltransferase
MPEHPGNDALQTSISFPTHAERLANAERRLTSVTETPRLDAELLLSRALGLTRSSLLARMRERAEAPGFEEMLRRRVAAEPIAYILGDWEFFSLILKVVPPLLVPRPETEHLVETVLDFIGKTPARILEIGPGTGCISVAIAKNASNARIFAVDINPIAVEITKENARRHGVENRIDVRLGNLFEPIETGSALDVICSNPPYIEDGDWAALPDVIRLHEDPRALLAGPDGLDVVREIVRLAPLYLRPGGLLAMEIGMGQARAVESLLAEAGWLDIHFVPDLAGIERIAAAVAP